MDGIITTDPLNIMKLSPEFINNIHIAFPAEGEKWIASLPQLLQDASARWNLTLGEAYELSYNYVCPAKMPNDCPAVLKIGVPNRELTSEIAALRLYAGEGACRLYEADTETGMMLLEYIHPGTMLHKYGTDEEQARIAAQVMKSLWRTAPEGDSFLSLQGWFDELQNLRPRFHGSTGPFPRQLVETVESLLPALFSETTNPVLLHGDCHHFNILDSERGWLAIDPKGVIGAPEYEPAPFLLNPADEFLHTPNTREVTERRIKIFGETLNLDPRRLHAWAICHGLLSAWWDTTDSGSGGEYSLACSELFLTMKI